MDDVISRAAALNTVQNMYKRCDTGDMRDYHDLLMEAFETLPSAQPEEASMILGVSKDGVRLWYQCSACGEPVNADDNYCCNCGRKFING